MNPMPITLTQAKTMTPITPLFTSSFLTEAPTLPGHCTPVVRYSDHCARVQELELDIANARRRCDELLKQLERMALVCEEQATRLNRMDALKTYHENKPLDQYIGKVVGRWDGKPKAL